MGFASKLGSRNEVDSSRGAAHLIAHSAFKSTTLSTHQRFVRDLETIGARVKPLAGREISTFKITSTTSAVGDALPLLADGTLNIRHAPWEIEEYSEIAAIQAANTKKCGTYTIRELIHGAFSIMEIYMYIYIYIIYLCFHSITCAGAAFFADSSLGQPVTYTEGYDDLTMETLQNFFKSHFTHSRSAGEIKILILSQPPPPFLSHGHSFA